MAVLLMTEPPGARLPLGNVTVDVSPRRAAPSASMMTSSGSTPSLSRRTRQALRRVLRESDGVDPDDVIMDADGAARRGLTSTVTFPKGNLAPGGSVIKSTAIDPSVVDAGGVYRKTGPARVFHAEKDAIAAIKSGAIRP